MGATYFRKMWPVSVLGLLALLCCTHAWPNTHNDVQCEEAPRCDQAACEALGTENCHCSGNETSIKIDDRPQIVYLTFDDAFSALAEEQFYRILFNGTFKNPNGCAIRATHFLTQSYTDYSLVNRYWHVGHEMASHSISHRNDLKYWKNMEVDGWKDEMVGLRKMIGQFASIDPCEVKGHRAPFLQGGGDNMFTMLSENNFLYDSSWPTRAYGYVDAENGLYPYTLDFASIQDCPIEPCPKCSYPGNKCGGAQACKFDVHLPDEGIDGERYMTICKKKQDGSIQSCPPSDRYPWLEDHCGGNTPCKDCGDS